MVKAVVKDTIPAIAPGVYQGRFDGVREETNDQGTFWLWTFSLAVPGSAITDTEQYGDEDAVIPLTATSSPRITPRTKSARWLEGLGVRIEVDDEIDFDALKGRDCQVVVIVSEQQYSRVDAVLPAPPRGKSSK